jgi:hypothetical protein
LPPPELKLLLEPDELRELLELRLLLKLELREDDEEE